VGKKVDVDDLIDAAEVALLAGFRSPTAVSSRYPAMDKGEIEKTLNTRKTDQFGLRKSTSISHGAM